MVRDAKTVEQLIDKPARGFPAWHEQTELSHALKIWSTDLYQDVQGAFGKFDARGWTLEVDDEMVRAARDCIELSAWLACRTSRRPSVAVVILGT